MGNYFKRKLFDTLKGLAMMSRGISLNEVIVVTTQKTKINNTIVKTNLT